MKMQDLMVDFETLGNTSDCCVISIGACFFDIASGTIGETFYRTFKLDGQMEKGRKISPDTLKWWMNQSSAAKKVFSEDAKPVEEVLVEFTNWVYSVNTISKIKPWGNGSSFDVSIFDSLFAMYNIKTPWLYYNAMDLRTFRRFVAKDVKVEKSAGVNHNALDDAINQANFVIKYTERTIVEPKEIKEFKSKSVSMDDIDAKIKAINEDSFPSFDKYPDEKN